MNLYDSVPVDNESSKKTWDAKVGVDPNITPPNTFGMNWNTTCAPDLRKNIRLWKAVQEVWRLRVSEISKRVIPKVVEWYDRQVSKYFRPLVYTGVPNKVDVVCISL